MLFNSLTFVFFLIIAFTLYWLPLSKSKRHQNIVLLVGSYVFYGWWDYRFLSLIFISSLCDYFLGLKIDQATDPKKRKAFLFASLGINLGILFVFKYFNFFVNSFMEAFSIQSDGNLLHIVLPVGISFYTFQTLSYSIDIYKGQIKPTKDALNFFTFVSFFPQLVAGPIERASNFLPQIELPRSFNYSNAVLGGRFMLYGMFKKVVIGDNVAEIANVIFATDSEYTGIMSVLGMCLFAIQIYCDFSGYSDIAIGTAKLFNVDLMTNFKRPYFSTSLTEFWGRWHISLSTWFRDYVYIPLGGSRVSQAKVIRNLLITFTVSGVWHGANWTFVIWGAIHGIVLVIEKLMLSFSFKRFKPLSWLITLVVVLIAWVFFRAESLTHAMDYLSHMGDFSVGFKDQLKTIADKHDEISLGRFFIALGLVVGFLVMELIVEKNMFVALFNRSKAIRYGVYLSLFYLILMFGAFQNAADFIYFQF